MYCPKCEFEIKGEGRKECPICGGSLIDFSSLASETPEDVINTPEEKPAENSQGPPVQPTFDLESLLNEDNKPEEQGPEPEVPPVEEAPAENCERHTFEKTGRNPGPSAGEPEEPAPFDFESALTSEDETLGRDEETGQETVQDFNFKTGLTEDEGKQGPGPEKTARTSPAPEHKPEAEPEPALEELSTEELLRRIAEEYKPPEEEAQETKAVPPPGKSKPAAVRPSRSFSAIAALAVFALTAAIASVAYLVPQEKLHPVIWDIKTETEKTITELSDLVVTNLEHYLYQQEEPASSVPQRKARPNRPVRKTVPATRPPVQGKAVPADKKPEVAHKIVPARSEKAAMKKPIQLQTKTEKDTLIPLSPQEKPSPQIVEEKRTVTPTVTKPARRNLYSLHTGSFMKESIASGEAERLKKMGFNSYVQKVSLKNGQTWYRTKVGSFNTREETLDVQEKLQQKAPHIKSYVMKKRLPAKATVAGEKTADSKPAPITAPAGSTRGGTTQPQDTPEVVEKQRPVKRAVTQEEKPLTGMNDLPEAPPPLAEKPQEAVVTPEGASSSEGTVTSELEEIIPALDYSPEAPQTMVGIPQERVESAEELSSAEAAITKEGANPAETGYNPYSQEAQGETSLNDTVSIETLPGITPEREDQASATIEISPETGVEEGLEALTPVE